MNWWWIKLGSSHSERYYAVFKNQLGLNVFYTVYVCVCVCVCVHTCAYSWIWLSVIPWTIAHQLLCPWHFAGKNTGVGCHFLFQEIFPIQGLNPHLLWLLHCQVDSLPLHHLGSPQILLNKWVAEFYIHTHIHMCIYMYIPIYKGKKVIKLEYWLHILVSVERWNT